WQSEPGATRGSWQPLGHRRLGVARAAGGLSRALYGPESVLDHRRRAYALARRRALRGRGGPADLARLCARPSGQRAGREPAGARGDQRGDLGTLPPPKLSGVARQRGGVGPRLARGAGGAAGGAHDPATPGAHPCRRAAATLAVWRRVRRLLRPDSTAASRAL